VLGLKYRGKSVTFPGLVGGVNESGSGNKYVSWGIFPKNDKRIVILDEIHNSEARPVLRQLNELRSFRRSARYQDHSEQDNG